MFLPCTGPDEWQLHSEDGHADVCVGGQGGQGLKGFKMDENGGDFINILATMNSVKKESKKTTSLP